MLQKSKPVIYLFPATVVLFLLFGGGIWNGLLQSMGYFPAANQYELTLEYYRKVLVSREFLDSFLVTIRIAGLSSIIAGVIGLAVSVLLFILTKEKSGKHGLITQKLFQLPMLVPPLVAGYFILLLFSQSGWVSKWMETFGLIDRISDFPVLVNDSFGWGIIMTYAWKESAFVALMLHPVLMRIKDVWLDVARVYGANSWKYFKCILFPLLFPSWMSALFIVFAFTFSAFEVPFLLGVTYPSMLPVYSYNLYVGGGLEVRPEALSVNIILVCMVVFIGALAFWVSRRWYRKGQGGW
ncbi:ABC transporter permease [Aquibacillus kalidii]|uniref:ABC transporter permease n=1 Tax=Aquibacillus kalidii TaxID=2762597 RepID=UPI001647B74D|nr:ABC transporter permease subunit [Aquibacillus kalidii]